MIDKERKFNVTYFIEIFRWANIPIAIFFTYYLSNDPVIQFKILSTWCVIAIAGLTGIEGIFFGKQASLKSGYTDGGPYQRQSAISNLSIAIAIVIATGLNWNIASQVGITTVMFTFLVLSSINHAYSAIKEKNHSVTNILRPILTLVLIIVLLPFMLRVL